MHTGPSVCEVMRTLRALVHTRPDPPWGLTPYIPRQHSPFWPTLNASFQVFSEVVSKTAFYLQCWLYKTPLCLIVLASADGLELEEADGIQSLSENKEYASYLHVPRWPCNRLPLCAGRTKAWGQINLTDYGQYDASLLACGSLFLHAAANILSVNLIKIPSFPPKQKTWRVISNSHESRCWE